LEVLGRVSEESSANPFTTTEDRALRGWPSPVPLTLFAGDAMIPISEFPAIDATLNATSARQLTLGYFFIRRKRIQAHNVCMLSAFATSVLFLLCYIWYHAHHGVTRFPGQGAVSDLYLALLGSQTSVTRNRSLGTPSVVLCLCYSRCRLVDAVSRVNRVGAR